jgi:hypothetical protein
MRKRRVLEERKERKAGFMDPQHAKKLHLFLVFLGPLALPLELCPQPFLLNFFR